MKRTSLFLLTLLACMLLQAQSVTYYHPRTALCFELTCRETISHRGPFYQYSERYLGTKDVVTEDGTSYELVSAQLFTQSQAATDHPFLFAPTKKVKHTITLSPKGILAGYGNIANEMEPEKNDKEKPSEKKTHTKNKQLTEQAPAIAYPTIMPLLEDALLASSLSKQAEAAAKQIYRIREARLAILSGEADHLPADGKAMAQTMALLDKQEAELVLLFVGEQQTRTFKKMIRLVPSKNMKDEVIARFSAHAGLVSAKDLSGEPIYINLQATYPAEVTTDGSKNAAKKAVPMLYYNLPGSADITLSYKGNELLSASKRIAQFGRIIPLTEKDLQSASLIRFSTTTGAILESK